jgi:hypothetical protein
MLCLDIQRNKKERNNEERNKREGNKREVKLKFYIVWMNRSREEKWINRN